MGSSNWKMAHGFYYKGVDDGVGAEYSRVTVSFTGYDGRRAVFRSYATAIGCVVAAAEGVAPNTSDPGSGVLLYSRDNMTPTTGRHISKLVSACPFTRRIAVPFKYGARNPPDAEELLDRTRRDLTVLSRRLSVNSNRREFVSLYDTYVEIATAGLPAYRGMSADDLSEFADTYRQLRDDEESFVKRERSRVAKESATKAKETKRLLEEYMPKDPVGRNAARRDLYGYRRFAADNRFLGLPDAVLRRLREAVRGKGNRVVWTETDSDGIVYVRTDAGIMASGEECRVLLKAWGLGHDLRTRKVGVYTILNTDGPVIKIGCHTISRDILTDLYEILVGKPWKEPEATHVRVEDQ